ncbi:MAG: NAD(P)/FAD-dependent oxidoreductase [Oscillospiraceae bacterium]
MYDVVIIGAGPAGISAAVYVQRAGFRACVLAKDVGALGKAHEIENYYGLEEPVSGAELARRGVAQAKRLGVQLVTTEAVGIGFEETLTVYTKDGNYAAASVIIATGAARGAPKLPGLKELEGHGVSFCAMCDAFFYRGRDVAVLGEGEFAAHEAEALLATSASVTILTDSKAPTAEFPAGALVDTRKITRILGSDRVSGVEFADGEKLDAAGLFVAVGVAGSADLAKKIGAPVENNRIVTDSAASTGIPGLFAAGDCTGGLLQVAKAVYEGALAGTEAVKYLRSIKRS